MPVFRYFIFVGGALLALLFAVNHSALKPAPVAVLTSGGDMPAIRIHSDRKLPERIVFDTRQPTVVAPAAMTAQAAPALGHTHSDVAEASANSNSKLRNSFAQMAPAQSKAEAASDLKPKVKMEAKAEVKPQRHRRHRVARARSLPPPGRPMMLVEQEPHFGLFNMTW